MSYYFTSGPPVVGMPPPASDKPGLYGSYNGHITPVPLQVPTQRTTAVAGAPIMQQGPPMPQPGGPAPIGLAGTGPLTAPSPMTANTPGPSPLQPGASPLHPGASQFQPTSLIQPNGQISGSSPYPVNVSSAAPTYMSPLPPAAVYGTSAAGLYQGATIAYPQPSPAPQSMPPPNVTPYLTRGINAYAAQGTPIHTVPFVQPPQTVVGPGYPGFAQAPVHSYGVAPMPGTMVAYAAPSQAPHIVPAGAVPSPYPQVMPQGLAGPGPGQHGAPFHRPPSMP